MDWHPLNDNRGVWSAPIGSRSVRDPFILRDEEGVYRLFSTNGWNANSILVADSLDLIEWTNPRLAPLMNGVAGVRNCWAPECFYDASADVYRAIWSSSLDTRTIQEMEGSADWNHRIWTCSTRDFNLWSAPELFFDPGFSVIDACVVPLEPARWMMAWKDERGRNEARPQAKKIKVSFSDSALGSWKEEGEFLTDVASEGPTLFRRDGGWTMLFDAFLNGYFGALHSQDEGQTWRDISDQVRFPPGPRHASVIEIPDEDGARLRARWS